MEKREIEARAINPIDSRTLRADNLRRSKNRKGAITPFIILAGIILITAAMMFYTGTLRNLFGPLRVAYPTEVEPVARYIQDCSAQTGTDAVNIIASQGGYITFPQEIEREYDSFLPLDDLNLKILPFWMRRGASRIPTIPAMEAQIGEYVTNRTIECLNDFKPLSDRYLITIEGNLTAKATLTSDTAFISLDYPIKVVPRATMKETRMRDFSTTIQARLKKAFELARNIMLYQDNQLAVENLTIDLMSSDPQIPMNHMGVECERKTWMENDIKTRLQEVIAANLLTVRIKNTDHVPFEADEKTYQKLSEAHAQITAALEEGNEDFNTIPGLPTNTPSDAFEYFHTYWDVGSEKTPMTAALSYRPEYGMDLSAAPSSNGMLSSTLYKASKNLLGFLCLNIYHFTYTARYPVRVSVYDPLSFGGKGLTFEYAFPAVISNNAPEPRAAAKRFISDIRPQQEFCARLGTQFYEIRAIGSDEEGYVSNTGLDEANISYRCAGRRCDLGTTSAHSGAYALITPLPDACKNPSIIARKPGYLKNERFLDETLTLIPLTRLNTIPVEIRKIPYFAIDKKAGKESEELASDENATLLIRALSAPGLSSTTSYPSSNSTITIMEGDADYSIDVALTKGERIIGGYHNSNITIKGIDAAKAGTATIYAAEYRPTPITDADETAMALYLMTGTPKDMPKPRLG